jgi:hypothetical protein
MIDALLVNNSRRLVWVYDGCRIAGRGEIIGRYHRSMIGEAARAATRCDRCHLMDTSTHSTGLKGFDSPWHPTKPKLVGTSSFSVRHVATVHAPVQTIPLSYELPIRMFFYEDLGKKNIYHIHPFPRRRIYLNRNKQR